MSKLQRALSRAVPPGIYCLNSNASTESMKKEAARAGWGFFVLDGSKIYDKKTFLEKIARAMRFPDYFGRNWDALNDCVTDMTWTRAEGFVLVFQEPRRFLETSPKDWDVALEILKSATESWQERGTPFYVLLRGKISRSFQDI